MLERHTGQNFAKEIKNVDEFKINVAAVIHDNASNMDSCLAIYGYANFGCAGHTLQPAVNDRLKIANVSKTL